MKLTTILSAFSAALMLSQMSYAINYTEGANGELSGDHNNPTTFAVTNGNNSIAGQVKDTTDYDYFKITIPPGGKLNSITVNQHNGPGSMFIAVASGSKVIPAPPNPGNGNNLIGYMLFGDGAVNTNILDDITVAQNGSTGATVPLPAGTYSFWVQDWTETVDYKFTFNVTVPVSVQAPVITPNGGSFLDSVDITMTTATAGAAIHYTTDGSAPTAASALYTAPVKLTTSAVVKAYAIKAGNIDSAVTTETYTITVSPPQVVPAPTLTVSGKKSLKTTKTSVKIKGSATNATSVEYRVGKGPFKSASGTTAWIANAKKLKLGKNVITVQAKGQGKTSAPAKVTVTVKK